MENKIVGEGVKFERIRRITGYLVGTTDRFNNGKKAEEKARVKHSLEGLDIDQCKCEEACACECKCEEECNCDCDCDCGCDCTSKCDCEEK